MRSPKKNHGHESLNWLAKLLKPAKKLDDTFQVFIKQEASLKEKKTCYLRFMQMELQSLKEQIEDIFQSKNIVLLNAPIAFGIHPFLEDLERDWKSREKCDAYYFRLNEEFQDAHQLALIIVKELGLKASTDPLTQLKAHLKEKNFLLIIEQSISLKASQFDALLQDSSMKLLVVSNSGSKAPECLQGKSYESLELTPLSDERAAELALVILQYRADLILTSAERYELLSLISLCDNLPEIIFMALAGPQNNYNLPIDKYARDIMKHRPRYSNENYETVLAFLAAQFPEEVLYLLQKAYYLPTSGFTANDLFVISRPKFSNKESILSVLKILTQLSWLQTQTAADLVIYQMPAHVKYFIQQNLLTSEENQEKQEDQIKQLLIQRLESNLLWREPRIWVSQLEQTLISLSWISKKKQYSKNRYFVLYIQSILMELGLWMNVEERLIPFCNEAVKVSENNEERGFWYSLLGLIHRGIAKYKEPQKQLDFSLLAFQKSLKFYDPQKQQKRYSFVYQNIGLVYSELYRRDGNEAHLKNAIKAYYKALGDEKRKEESAAITLKRLLAQSYYDLGCAEKPTENFLKSFNMYKQALEGLQKNQEDPRLKVIWKELEKLQKQIKTFLPHANAVEKIAFENLKAQLEEQIAKKPAMSQVPAKAIPQN